MKYSNFHIFGVGEDTSDLRYIGWTEKSINEEKENIFSELTQIRRRDVAHWVQEARNGRGLSIFEIETTSSADDARRSVIFWCRYYQSLGLDVVTDG